MENFDEAKQESEELFGRQTALEDTAQEEPTAEQPEEGAGSEMASDEADAQPEGSGEPMTEQALQTAEMATQAAVEKDQQLQQVTRELSALREQNENLQKTISQMSEQQKEAVVESSIEMPVLDIGSLTFDDEETVRQKQADYAQKMAQYVRENIMGELTPFVQQAKEGQYEKEKSEVIETLSQIPELADIKEHLPQLERIIENNRALSLPDVPVDEKYITAYAIAKGVNSINTPPKGDPTAEELMQFYESNPDFQELIEKKRAQALKPSQQVPLFSASSGAVNAALNIPEKPKSWDDASQRTRKMFGE